MMTSRRRSRRTEDLIHQPMVRRSPRLSSRPPVQFQQYIVSSRASLGGRSSRRHSKSRSTSPNTILNESGQSVPATFEGNEVIGTHCLSRGEGMPHHLYGPTRVWNIYDKERIVVTTTGTSHESDIDSVDDGGGLCSRIFHFFTSILFKVGSLLYLATAAILCLDVIILHRLFNFASFSRGGSMSRFFFLLLGLCALIGSLLGGHVFTISPSPESPVESDISGTIPLNISDAALESLKYNVMKFVRAEVEKDLKQFEDRYRREIDSRVDLALSNSESKAGLDFKEQLASEVEQRKEALLQLKKQIADEISNAVEQRILELRDSMESRVSEMPGQLEITKKLLESKIEDFRDDRRKLSEAVEEMVDRVEYKQKGLDFNMSTMQLHLDRHDERISTVEEKQKEILLEIANFKANYLSRLSVAEATLNDSIPERVVINIFNEELEKATSDKNSPLRLWLNLIFASKSDLQTIHKEIDRLQAYKFHGDKSTSLTRQDIEDMIAFSLRRYSADKIARFDFALESSGGSMMCDHSSATYSHSVTSVSLFGFIPLWHTISSPKVIIQPSLYPGNCWAMEGQNGYATIKLRNEVVITGVTLDHIPRELSPNGSLDTAPKDFSVHALTSLDEEPVKLGKFTYDINGTPIQQFQINDDLHPTPYRFVRFDFLSNYGNHNYTCIYRVRVHGHYP